MKNKNIKGENIKIESRRDLRNTIMHIISKYKNSDKMISLNDMKEIYGGIVKFGEKNYTKSLLRNCEKNIPRGYLTSLQRFIAPPLDVTTPYSQMLSKEDQQLLDYLKDGNSFLKAAESNKDKNQISEIEPISLDNFQNGMETNNALSDSYHSLQGLDLVLPKYTLGEVLDFKNNSSGKNIINQDNIGKILDLSRTKATEYVENVSIINNMLISTLKSMKPNDKLSKLISLILYHYSEKNITTSVVYKYVEIIKKLESDKILYDTDYEKIKFDIENERSVPDDLKVLMLSYLKNYNKPMYTKAIPESEYRKDADQDELLLKGIEKQINDKLIPNFQAEMVNNLFNQSVVVGHEMSHKVPTKSSKTDEIFGSDFGEETTTTRKSGGKESRVTTHTVESTTTRIEDYDVAPGDNYIYEDGDSGNIQMQETDKYSSSVDNKEEVKERDVYQVADNIEKLLIEAGYENLADDLRNEIGFICPPELRWYRLNNFINNKVSKNPEDIYCVKIYSELVNKTEKEMKELMMQTTKQNVEPTIRENFILLENSAHTIYKEEKFGVVHERRVLSDGEGIISQTPDGKFYVNFDGTSTWVAEQELENGRIVKNTISCHGKWNGMPEEYNTYNVEMIKKINNN